MRHLPFALLTFVLLFLPAGAENLSKPYRIPVEIQSPPAVELRDANSDRERTEDIELSKSDLAAQWLAAKSADRMVSLSWVQLAATAITIVFAFMSIKISRDAFESDSRPVMIADTPIFGIGLGEPNDFVGLTVRATNYGKGVAFVRSYSFRLSQLPVANQSGGDLGSVQQHEIHWPLASGQYWELQAEKGAFIQLQRAFKNGVLLGTTNCFFYGEIAYTSTNKKRYSHRFAYQWNADKSKFESHVDEKWWQ